jgi:hypothetical protein
MNSTTTDRFWRLYSTLPSEVKRQAKETYSLFVSDPYHPSLHFKRIHSTRPVFSVRIGIHYRAVGVLDEQEITWFWIGSHAEYDRLVRQLRKS